MKKRAHELTFIPVTEARNALLKNTHCLGVIERKVAEAVDYVIAADIKAPLKLPPFNQSAMDGYAFRFSDFKSRRDIEIIGELAAGSDSKLKLRKGQAVRIFTGAPIPNGADTVVIQEKVYVERNALIIKDDIIVRGANIRIAGSEIKKGIIALKKGTLVTPAALGFLTSLGITDLKVFKKPEVTLIITGDELAKPGSKLKPGQIFESNGTTLTAALKKLGVQRISQINVKDNFQALRKALHKSLPKSDIIIFSGGISVGDYDYVSKLMVEERVNTIFYKVKQKPGKPFYSGYKSKTLIFGVPGNPASALTCFYEYIELAVMKMQGIKEPRQAVVNLKLGLPITKKTGLTVFYKAHTNFDEVFPLEGQASYIMKSFAQANCLIEVGENVSNLAKGDVVKVHLLGL